MIAVTERHLDDALNCVDTIEVCGALLASDGMTDELADDALLIADEILRLRERLAALRNRPVDNTNSGDN